MQQLSMLVTRVIIDVIMHAIKYLKVSFQTVKMVTNKMVSFTAMSAEMGSV